ncbi:MAG: hypothetical protein KDF60_20040, partial [Calditrichaeota bacterium]|nr:hypothetical protein [Calditrichota bacterium]
MIFWLEKGGLRVNSLVKYDSPPQQGIRLIYCSESDLPNTIKSEIKKDGQSFHLSTRQINNAVITGTGKNSFINGIYTFLQELGYRWYMPGDTWTIVPERLPKLYIDKTYTPVFRDRIYAGSGGINAIQVIDEKNQAKKDFELWNKRNRFSADYPARSHSGAAFYNANKELLDKHPEYFCNNKVNQYGRVNIEMPAVVNLFVDWALRQAKTSDEFPLIGVDPADGSGGSEDCLPTRIPLVKTWSD